MDRSLIRPLITAALAENPDLAVLRDPGSWSILRDNAALFGVAPVIAFIARPYVTSEARAWCDQTLTRSWTRHETSLRDLENAGAVLGDAGIPYIPMKGPLLARRVYQPAFLRKPSVDLDLAIRNTDLEGACAALGRAGYEQAVSIRDARACLHDVALYHKSKTRIELHFRMSHAAFGARVDEFFDRAVGSKLPSGRPTLLLSPTDELLHLVLHFASDRFRSLFHSYELRRMWNAAPVQLREGVIARAVDYGFSGTIALVDIGFRLRWNQPFVPASVNLPRTWLSWGIGADLYESLENWERPGWGLSARLRARWLDFRTTDTPADALRMMWILGRVAGMRLKRREWGHMRPLKSNVPRIT